MRELKKNSFEFMSIVANADGCFEKGCPPKRGRAYVTMWKIIMGYGCLSEAQVVSAWWKETAQTLVFVKIR